MRNPHGKILQKVRDAGLIKEFIAKPVETLDKLGVDSSDLRLHQTKVVEGATHSACVSSGCGACVSVG